ncbi:MAG TPA: Sec-independent protein translocase subunit TatA [Actinomadura sp.]|nr:Sec-independent protein translocase subunit TatA [Actinomadura sp.]
MAGLGTSEILIILLVVLLLFGSAKLPQLARSLGKSARILKAETKGLRDDEDPAQQAQTEAAKAQADAANAKDKADHAAQQNRPQRELPPSTGDGTTINGLPLSEAERDRRTS